MKSGGEFPGIAKPELLARLAGSREARLTVVTPNQRLAGALRRDFDSRQLALGLVSWETADILPLDALVERFYEDALYSPLAAQLPILLSGAQEQALWEEIVASSESARLLVAAPPAAALAREAWRLAHAWRLMPRLKGYPANDDARAFAGWAWRYEGRTQRDRITERARLPDVVAPRLADAAFAKPRTLVAYGFDILDAQQRGFLDALAEAGVALASCGPTLRDAAAHRAAFNSANDEILAAARWARARMEADSGARIGVVVPDLARSRNRVRRLFAQVMEPARPLPGNEARTLPFNISLGEPLSCQALVAAALTALEFAHRALGFERVSRLIRSPFIGGAESEFALRARLDVELRAVSESRLTLDRLRRSVEKITQVRCPLLARHLGELAGFGRDTLHGARRPAEWAQIVSGLLGKLGFPGERPLDSTEYQALAKFHAAIAEFAALDHVAPRMRFDDACARLARLAADTPFQPEAPEVPIQVLGVIESAGMEFDCLWVMGLTEEAWPFPARPNPFIPVALQRAAGVPEASAAASLELDARITRGWLAAAGEVVLSHPLREEDRELMHSPLIASLPPAAPADLATPIEESLRDAVRRARGEERVADARAPAPSATSAGGTAVFRDQAACPFRAFAVHRLDAARLETPVPGLNARDRGTLVHAMFAQAWQELKSGARLDAMEGRERDALLERAADHAIGRLRRFRPDAIRGRAIELERTRLARLGRAWLELERDRPAFEVAAIEEKRTLSFGGTAVNAKLDRLDRLEAGGCAVIDYKTGSANVGDWFGPRPDDPQLPLYAVSGGEAVAAVAFACVKPGQLGFKGVARDDLLLPGVGRPETQRSSAAKGFPSWNALLEHWRSELESLGSEFAAGEARVDPKRGGQTCRNCGLTPLCRINERAALSLEGAEGEA